MNAQFKPLPKGHLIQPQSIGYSSRTARQMSNEDRQQSYSQKIENFCNRAIYPQTLTLPRDPLLVPEGFRIVKWLEGRIIDGYREKGIRVIVAEGSGHGMQAKVRLHMSPLCDNRHDAETWARSIGVT